MGKTTGVPHPAFRRDGEDEPERPAKERFARGMAHAEFGRFYADGQDLARVAQSNANALARVREARKAAAKARAKAAKSRVEA